MSTTRDVNLVVRARDDATKAFEAATAALQGLLGASAKVGDGAVKTGNRLDELASAAAALDKAFQQIDGAATRASSAFDRQQSRLAESRAELAAVRSQADNAAAALARLRGEAERVGPPQGGPQQLAAQIAAAESEYARLERAQAKLTRTIGQQEAAIDGQRSSLQRLGSTAIAAADAQARVEAETELQAAAMRDAAAAAERLSDVQRRINAVNGVGRSAGSAAAAAEVLQLAAARDAEIIKLRDQERATAELARAQEAQARASRLIANDLAGKSARDSAAVFQEADAAAAKRFEDQIRSNAAATREMDAAAARLRAELNPLSAIEQRVAAETAKVNALFRAGKISADEQAGALALLRTNADKAAASLSRTGGRRGGALFGLEPYQLQNLSFQINDVFTQLASGTSLTQTLAQQGGQILQIFPRIGSAIVSAFTNPAILAFVVTIGSVAAGLSRAADQAERLRNFSAILSASADGARVQADALADVSRELDRYGLSADEALKTTRALLQHGIDPARIEAFGRTAKNLANVMGLDLAEASRLVTDAFTGGYEAVRELDKVTNTYTASQLEQIRLLFEQGRATEAQNLALDIYSGKMQEAADKQRGEWSDAVRSLGNAWDSFLSFVSNTQAIQNAIGWLQRLGDAASSVFQFLDSRLGNSGTRTAAAIRGEIATLEAQLRAAETTAGKSESGRRALAPRIESLRTRLGQLEEELGRSRMGNTSASTMPSQRQIKIDADIARADQKRLAAAKELSAEKRIQIAYEDAFNAALKQGASEQAAGASADIAARLERQKIDKEGAAARNKADRESERLAKAAAREAERKEKQQADFNNRLDDENESRRLSIDSLSRQNGLTGEALILEQRRQAIAEAILRAQQAAEKSGLTFTSAQREEIERTTGALFDLSRARDIEEAKREAVDRPVAELSALRDSLQSRIADLRQSGQGGEGNALQQDLAAVNAALVEAVANARAYYAALDPANNTLGLSAAELDNINLKFDALIAGSRQWVDVLGVGGEQIAQTFASGATNALDRFAESIARGGNAFRSLASAFLSFAQTFLQQIAQMIVQQQIFNLIAGIASGIGGGVGGGTNGTGAVGGLQAHKGGIIGGKGPTHRWVAPSWFADATRYHTGGIAGLKPNEVPAILERGEEVLTRGDPRHAANGGGGGVKIVNAIDAGDFVSKGLETRTGERAILNFIRANSGAVRSAMGG